MGGPIPIYCIRVTCPRMNVIFFMLQNRKPTIRKKEKGGCKLGQRDGFSDTDIKKINTLYSCTGYPQTTGGKPGKKPTVVPTVKPDLSCQDNNKLVFDNY